MLLSLAQRLFQEAVMKMRLFYGLAVIALLTAPLLAFAPIRVDANNDGPANQPAPSSPTVAPVAK
jgi:hypothetical protein